MKAARRTRAVVRRPQKPNWENRTMVTGDNLAVLKEMSDACVDLIYLDPPFNSNRNYSAPIGSKAAGASFKDIWTLDDMDEQWLGQIAEENPALFKVVDAAGAAQGDGTMAYLCAMSIRLLQMKRVLKDTGSIYLHCDPTASHYLKAAMDVIFGKANFRNEIVWGYKGNAGNSTKKFSAKHDVVLFYANGSGRNFYSPIVTPYSEEHQKRFNHVDKDGRRFYWNGSAQAGRYKTYMKEGVKMGDFWADIPNLTSETERTGYPTQKPRKLLERIISASSNKGDVVLDPFAGCATACVAAEILDRQWIGIDISDEAVKQVKTRMKAEALNVIHKVDSKWRAPRIKHVKTFATKANKAKVSPRDRKYNDPENKQYLFGLQRGHCKVCGNTAEYKAFHVDHIKAKAQGGTDKLDNLQLLCGPCNLSKSSGSDKKAKKESVAAIKRRIKEDQARVKAILAN